MSRPSASHPLVLTEAGAAALEQAHRARRAAFGAATADWTAEERAEFARLLTRLVAAMPG